MPDHSAHRHVLPRPSNATSEHIYPQETYRLIQIPTRVLRRLGRGRPPGPRPPTTSLHASVGRKLQSNYCSPLISEERGAIRIMFFEWKGNN